MMKHGKPMKSDVLTKHFLKVLVFIIYANFKNFTKIPALERVATSFCCHLRYSQYRPGEYHHSEFKLCLKWLETCLATRFEQPDTFSLTTYPSRGLHNLSRSSQQGLLCSFHIRNYCKLFNHQNINCMWECCV